MIPTRKNPEQMASVATMSSRVVQASASAASVQSANRSRMHAGINRQSTSAPNGCIPPLSSKNAITQKANVTRIARVKTVLPTKGRSRK